MVNRSYSAVLICLNWNQSSWLCVQMTTAMGKINTTINQPKRTWWDVYCRLEREQGIRKETGKDSHSAQGSAWIPHTHCSLSSSLVYCFWPTARSLTSCCPILWEITSLSHWLALQTTSRLSYTELPLTTAFCQFTATSKSYKVLTIGSFESTKKV